MTRLSLPLFLFTALGCDGRYQLGDTPDRANGGASNAGGSTESGGGSSGSSTSGSGASVNSTGGRVDGSSGRAGGGQAGMTSSGGSSDAEAGSAESAGSSEAGAGGTGELTRGRWLASETFVSSSSTQTALSLVDLRDPAADPIVLDGQSGHLDSFSPDGRWLLSYSYPSASAVDFELVDLKGEQPSAPQFLFTNRAGLPCRWSPDASRLACIEDQGQANDAVRSVVLFDTSGPTVGALTAIGDVPALSTGAAVGSERELLFLDRDHLVYSYGAQDFARITWSGAQRGAPELLGLGGGTIVAQSPDGARVLVKGAGAVEPAKFLADLLHGQARPLDASLGIGVSPSFEAAYGSKPGPESSVLGVYFSLKGIELNEQGEAAVDPGQPTFSFNGTFVGRHLARTKGQQVVVLTVRDNGVVEQAVSGDYANVNELDLDPTGNWLYIGTTEFDAQQLPIAASAKHYLSQLNAEGPAAAQLVGEGYSVGGVHFSPDARRLVLHGYGPNSSNAVAFRLLDLSDPSHITATALDLPLNWSDTRWSPDSSHVSFIGGSPTKQVRPLYTVNALTPTAPPRLIVQCPGNTPAVACPSVASFQP